MIIFKDNDTDCDNLIRTHFLSNDMLTENMIKIKYSHHASYILLFIHCAYNKNVKRIFY